MSCFLFHDHAVVDPKAEPVLAGKGFHRFFSQGADLALRFLEILHGLSAGSLRCPDIPNSWHSDPVFPGITLIRFRKSVTAVLTVLLMMMTGFYDPDGICLSHRCEELIMWIWFASGSAAFISILAKTGIEGVNSNPAAAIRTGGCGRHGPRHPDDLQKIPGKSMKRTPLQQIT